MIQYQVSVRNNTPQPLQYTFYDQNGKIIDLTSYVSTFVELKLQGQLYATIAASFVSPKTLGQVQLASYTHTQIGIWDAQFYIVDGVGNKVYGEPVQYRVVPNVDDLALTQLLVY